MSPIKRNKIFNTLILAAVLFVPLFTAGCAVRADYREDWRGDGDGRYHDGDRYNGYRYFYHVNSDGTRDHFDWRLLQSDSR